ncbi:MAG: hypothetical protein JW804_04240 [Sedimentisphaerales bacterium]|nr:hypothetical protein [Sedimentisphaerales bacterium]
MDDFDVKNMPEQPQPDDETIPFDDSDIETEISRSPLDLGGNKAISMESKAPKKTGTGKLASSPDRITGVKMFFTKLHAGAMDFLSGQINEWLAENPGVVIKHTNAVIGEVSAKKTEPNLIITVWY